MITVSKEEMQARLEKFNKTQAKVKRDRTYIPLEIDESTDTCSSSWLYYCLALNLVNKPSARERESTRENLKKENSALYEQVLPLIQQIENKHFSAL